MCEIEKTKQEHLFKGIYIENNFVKIVNESEIN